MQYPSVFQQLTAMFRFVLEDGKTQEVFLVLPQHFFRTATPDHDLLKKGWSKFFTLANHFSKLFELASLSRLEIIQNHVVS